MATSFGGMVGYRRYEGIAAAERTCEALPPARLFVNAFQPLLQARREDAHWCPGEEALSQAAGRRAIDCSLMLAWTPHRANASSSFAPIFDPVRAVGRDPQCATSAGRNRGRGGRSVGCYVENAAADNTRQLRRRPAFRMARRRGSPDVRSRSRKQNAAGAARTHWQP